MSYHPGKASEMIHDGLYPDTVRTFVFKEGTISNTHFVAIPFNAADKEGAMVVANFLISAGSSIAKSRHRSLGRHAGNRYPAPGPGLAGKIQEPAPGYRHLVG